MSNANKDFDVDDIDNYISTFQLKTFDDSDEDEDDIFSMKKNKQDKKSDKIGENEVSQLVNDQVLAKEVITKKIIEGIKHEPLPENKIEKANVINAPSIEVITSMNKTIIAPSTSKLIINNPPKKTIQPLKVDNSFKNISEDYKNIFNKKVELFTSEEIDYEISKIANEDDSFEIINLNNESTQPSINNNNNEQITYNKEERKNIQPQVNNEEINNLNFQIIVEKNIIPKKENNFTQYIIKDEVHKYAPQLSGKFSRNNIIILNSNPNSNKITLKSISSLSLLSSSPNDIETILNNDYLPISYSLAFDSNSKYKTIIKQIKTKIENKEIKTNREEYIIINLLHSYLENNFNCSLLDSSNIGISKRKEFISICKKLQFLNNVKENNNNKLFKLDEEKTPVDYSVSNLLSKGIEKLLVECYNEKSINNLVFFSLFGRKEDIFMYMSTIFEEHPEFKQDDLYFLFMIKSGNINKLIKEKKDFIFQNFYPILFLLLQNYEYFDYFNKTVDKSLILCIINNNFTRIGDKTYANKISHFLNFPTLVKILIADFHNYLIFQVLKDEDKEKLSVVGFCSILIKYKYVSIKIQNGEYENNKQYCEYGSKIYENIQQFGNYSKNKKFQDYIREQLIGDHSGKLSDTFKMEKVQAKKKQDVDVKKETPIFQDNKRNIFDREEKIESNILIKKEDENKKGIGSFLISALGFGSNRPNKPDIIKPDIVKPDIVKPDIIKPDIVKPEQIEQNEKEEDTSEMYYDTNKKRWVLRGKIYDDNKSNNPTQASNTNLQESKSKPGTLIINDSVNILPPKINIKPKQPTVTVIHSLNVNQIAPKEKMTITNPFAVKREPSDSSSIKQNSQVDKPTTQKPNLTSRYTSIIDYNN